MNVLALDGALGSFSAAIACGGRIAAAHDEPGNVALERGLAVVEDVCGRARLTHGNVDRLGVGIGPGRFTALRIAIAYAKALAAAWDRPLVPITSFDILEYGGDFHRVLTVVEGRPGVISARYRVGDQARRASGRIADVLDALFPLVILPFDSLTLAQDRLSAQDDKGKAQDDTGELPVMGAPEDVLHALAERAIIVRRVDPLVTPAAAAAALAAGTRSPARSLHEIRADYGELPAVTKPRR